MSKIELIYSQQSTDFIKGRAYANPRFFISPRTDVAKVFLIGEWPNIRAAYEAMGVPVERLDADGATAKPEPMKPPASVVSDMTAEQRAAVVIPDDWAGLGWTKAGEAGVSLRALATSLSDTPILNKADAAAAIEAELARRAAAEHPAEEPAAE